ncbi:MAG: hypothetical protein H6642_11190 [Caldilineaceae bacterium]|nr:hypothetical protein [Caldilineaceae bacterium]
MKPQPVGPSKFSLPAKTTATALAITSMIGVWGAIGHLEAARAQSEALPEQPVQAVTVTPGLPDIAALPTPASIPTLRVNTADFITHQLDEAEAAAPVDLALPGMSALAPLPTLEPLPALPQKPAPPPPSRSSNNNNGGSNSSGGSSKSGSS